MHAEAVRGPRATSRADADIMDSRCRFKRMRPLIIIDEVVGVRGILAHRCHPEAEMSLWHWPADFRVPALFKFTHFQRGRKALHTLPKNEPAQTGLGRFWPYQ